MSTSTSSINALGIVHGRLWNFCRLSTKKPMKSFVEVSTRPDRQPELPGLDHAIGWWAWARSSRDFSREMEIALLNVCIGVLPKQ
jgi:hypothetical protein